MNFHKGKFEMKQSGVKDISQPIFPISAPTSPSTACISAYKNHFSVTLERQLPALLRRKR
jgi:hypothetical protein